MKTDTWTAKNLHAGLHIVEGSNIAEVVGIEPTNNSNIQTLILHNQDGTVTEKQMPIEEEVEVLDY